MLIKLLTIIGISSLAISLLMLYMQLYNSDFMSKKRRNTYLLASKKSKASRTAMDQKFIDRTWHQYYATKIRNISFKIAIVVVPIAMLLNYITKQ